jgi:hypothetical protein
MSIADPTDASLDATDLRLVRELARGRPVTAAAAAVGVSSATCYRRMRAAGFKLALIEARAAQFIPVAGRAVRTLPASLRRLLAIIADDTLRPSDHVAAVRLHAELATKFIDLADLVSRVAALEHEAVHGVPPPPAHAGDPGSN